jgi:hypothetical protein
MRKVDLDDDVVGDVPGDSLERQLRAFWIAELRAHNFNLTGRASDYGSQPILAWDGGRSMRSGRTFKPAWGRLIQTASSANVSPFDVIRVALRAHKGAEPPPPNKVITAMNVELARRETDRLPFFEEALKVAREALALEFHKLRANQAYSGDAARWTALLLNCRLDISPLLRYCEALRQNLPRVATHWFIPAVGQYLPDRALYDEVWRDELPPDLRGATATALADIIEGANRA